MLKYVRGLKITSSGVLAVATIAILSSSRSIDRLINYGDGGRFAESILNSRLMHFRRRDAGNPRYPWDHPTLGHFDGASIPSAGCCIIAHSKECNFHAFLCDVAFRVRSTDTQTIRSIALISTRPASL